MITNQQQCYFEINNINKYQPFLVEYEDIGNNTIQVDITGLGVINYFGNITNDLLLEINTNINNALTEYSNITNHNSANIGYYFELLPTKKYDKNYRTFLNNINLTIVFDKPIPNVSAYSLTPTVMLITSTILEEIFILNV